MSVSFSRLFTGSTPIASDKCLDNNGGCQQNCVVAGDNFYCSCDTGYSIYTDGKRCAGNQATNLSAVI